MNSVDVSKTPAAFQTLDDSDQFAYRSISKATVMCVVFAVLSALLAFIFEVFVVIPLIGVFFGVSALISFRRFPNELIGKPIAIVATIFNVICLVASVGTHAYIYATEVPDGYQRISFSMLNPDPKSGLHYSQDAEELDGKKVFVRGYVRPSVKRSKLKKFILVGDFGSCCFGGNPKLTDVVAVDITNDKTVNFSYRRRKIGGIFRLNKRPRVSTEKDVPGIIYEIEADHIQ